MRFARAGVVLLLACGCGSSSEPNPGAAASLAVVSGGAQEAAVGTELPDPVVVKVTDANGRPVLNQIINFVVVSGGGSVFAGTTQTNAQGEARERWTLGTLAGEQVLEARAVDQSTGEPLVFARMSATALPGPVVEILVRPGLSPIFLGQQVDVALLIVARDGYVNIIVNPPLTLSAAPPFQIDGTKLSSTAEVSDAITLTSGAVSISRTVTALRDLHELVGAAGGWGCLGRGPYLAGEPEGTLMMSHQSTTFVVDSVDYLSPGDLQLFITTTTVSNMEDGSTRTDSGNFDVLRAVQHPGGLDWGYESGSLSGRATLTSESPLSYSGGDGCNGWNLTEAEPFTITK